MDDKAFEKRHQALMDARKEHPLAVWPDIQLKRLEERAMRMAPVEQKLAELAAAVTDAELLGDIA